MIGCKTTMKLLTDDPDWSLRVTGFDPTRERGVESLLTVGNGHAGTRGSLEEGGTASLPATFLAGLFDPIRRAPEPPSDLAESPALVVAPSWLALTLYVDDERLSLEHSQALEHERVLDLQQGAVVRRWRHRLPSGRITRLVTLRCTLLPDRHALLQRAWIVPENHGSRLRLTAALDGRVAEAWPSCPQTVPVGEATVSPPVLVLRTPRSDVLLALAQSCALSGNGGVLARESRTEMEPRCLTEWWEWQAEAGRTYVFERFVAALTSRQAAEPAAAAADGAPRLRARGASRLLAGHREWWAERWRAADVRIGGDAAAQRALRFASYHLMAAANPADEHVSIGARTLSGGAYRGHVFWDTEIYMLPVFIFTWPAAARALLMYRYHTLDAARAKAARLGYRGALYAWECAGSGHETTPSSVRTPEGEMVPIFTGRRGHHISADVAYAVSQYWCATADDDFFLQAGAEIALETARFWASRAQVEPDGRYHIRGVIGPDEYHEQVDDSAYTNALARRNLEIGRETAAWLQRRHPRRWRELSGRLALEDGELGHWQAVGERLVSGYDPQTRLIEQFAGYFGLEDLDLRACEPRSAAMQVLLGRERTAQTQVIKQADVVLLTHLLWDRFEAATVARNFAYYEPRCDHASSLSPGVHALVAARLGQRELARRYFEQAAAIDLSDNMGNAAQGIHAAACGGLWQAAVFGVAGMQLLEDGLAFDPHLLPGWESLVFAVQWRGQRLEVAVRRSRQWSNCGRPPALAPSGCGSGRGTSTGWSRGTRFTSPVRAPPERKRPWQRLGRECRVTRQRLVLVPLDASPASRTALAVARRAADFAVAELCILHVSTRRLADDELLQRLGLSDAEVAGVGLAQAVGTPAPEIVRLARERHVWLIVMSTQGERAWREHRLGSTTAAVIQECASTVLAVRPDMPEPRRSLRQLARILLPLDGSPSAAAAVAPVADLARRTEAQLHLLHVATMGRPLPQEPGAMIGPRYLDEPEHEWPAWAQEFRQRFGPSAPELGGVAVQVHAHGDPGEKILRFAQEQQSDLIATAWHQSLAPARAAVVKRLLAEAPCPLLFVRADSSGGRAVEVAP